MTPGLMLTSEGIDQLATALSAAQGELKDAEKTSENKFAGYKYADLAEILQTARPILAKHGLAVIQGVAYDNGHVHVTTRLVHSTGQFAESMVSIPVGKLGKDGNLSKPDAQQVGSAATYGRKYGFTAMVGMAQDDDDGEAASEQPTPRKRETGSNTRTQGPVAQGSLDLGPVAKAMITRFETATDAEMKVLTEEWASLTPVEQTQVLPAAKAARARLDGAKTQAPK